jgi:hypothetical protein
LALLPIGHALGTELWMNTVTTRRKLFFVFSIAKKLPPNVDPLGVFANDDIDLGEIDVYGFDYDYTLATYRTDVEQLIHHCAKQALVDKFKV